jgi:hypothetical protein
MIEDIKALIESHGNLALQAHEQYSPLVNSIIATRKQRSKPHLPHPGRNTRFLLRRPNAATLPPPVPIFNGY